MTLPLEDLDHLLGQRPHLIAADAVTLPAATLARMQAIIAALETVVALPTYRQAVLADAPAIARFDPGPRGVFLGYDFHLRDAQPWLIEINTNAGGGMINARLNRDSVQAVGHEADYLAMFREEWRLQRGDAPLASIAIVDERPAEQFLYPEFLMFQGLFRRHGLNALIADPAELSFHDGRLWAADTAIDLVYNRLTDFMLAAPAQAALREAYLAGAVVLTPHPHAHAVYANKRNLTLLCDPQRLAALGVEAEVIATLAAGVPQTIEVDAGHADILWQRRRELFFKPLAGYGGKAVYRGEKLTRGVWQEILAGGYVAQTYIPPSRTPGGEDRALKEDYRLYVYAGHTQLVAARLYRGQTTNFRTPSGGFARVLHDA
jgi:hypothetical protein